MSINRIDLLMIANRLESRGEKALVEHRNESMTTLELYKIANDIKEYLELHDDRPTPTCHISETGHEYEDSVRCDRCNMTFNRPWEPFRFCPECGAKVVYND